jgi:hypothetical protein
MPLNSAPDLPAFGRIVRTGNFDLKPVSRRKGLRGRAENPLELAAEVRLAGEPQFSHGGSVGVSLHDQFFCQTTLQFPKPMARGAIEIAPENSLQLPLRNGAERGHFRRIKVAFPRQLRPFLFRNFSTHRTSTNQFSSTPATAILCEIRSICPSGK